MRLMNRKRENCPNYTHILYKQDKNKLLLFQHVRNGDSGTKVIRILMIYPVRNYWWHGFGVSRYDKSTDLHFGFFTLCFGLGRVSHQSESKF